MKYLKTYEDHEHEIKKNNWVVTNIKYLKSKNLDANSYINSIPYKIRGRSKTEPDAIIIGQKLDKINPNYYKYFICYKKYNLAIRFIGKNEILKVFKTEDEANLFLKVKEYNL